MPYLGTVEATEILGPTANGNCRPLRIRDSNSNTYAVKGMAEPGRSSLVSELICVQLAERLGLNVPDYAVMRIQENLIDFSMEPLASNLIGGLAFASKWADGASDLTYHQSQLVPERVQQLSLLFDVWIGNGDRELNAFNGNVNLLWSPDRSPIVFDHNLAFRADLPKHWVEDHVFSGQAHTFRDYATRDAWVNEIDKVLADWAAIISIVPDEWRYWDGAEKSSVTHPSIEERLAWLERIKRDPETFWSDL